VSAWVLRGDTGLRGTFDFYDDAVLAVGGEAIGAVQRPGRDTAAVALSWIEAHREMPFFFLLHLFEPHSPYEPPEPHASRYDLPYDGEIATADDVVGAFLDRLRELDVYDRSLVVLTSDHGEGLGEHGEDEHGIFLYREALQVPLLIKLPGARRAGEVVEHPVQLVDLVPTLLTAVGVPAPDRLPGSDILAADLGRAPDPRIRGETLYPRLHLGWSPLASVIEGRFHFILAPRPELYDLESDPGESRNLVRSDPARAAELRSELEFWWDPSGAAGEVSASQADALRALGYLGASATGGDLAEAPDPKDRIHEIGWLRDAARAAEEGRIGAATAGFRRVLTANPNLTDAWLQLARTCESGGRLEEAAEAYAEAIARAPGLAGETSLAAARVMARLERLEEARRLAEMATSLRPGEAHLLLGDIALARGDASAATGHARTAATFPATRLPARVLLARALALQGPDEAEQALRILDETERDAEATGRPPLEGLAFARGDALARLQHLDAAAAAFEREIAGFPRHRQAYTSLAVVRFLQRRPREVVDVLEAMLAANPDPTSYRLAARTVDQLGDERRAAAWRRQAKTMERSGS
jgi:tetratricopeptide (TPR) repeat protein